MKNYVFPNSDLLTDCGETAAPSRETAMRKAEETVAQMADEKIRVTLADDGVAVSGNITRYSFIPDPKKRIAAQIEHLEKILIPSSAEPIRVYFDTRKGGRLVAEIPNDVRLPLSFRTVVDSEEFKNAKNKTAVCLGRTVEGEPLIADIKDMPHAIVAGSAGSGKSVSLHAMILSMIWRASPEEIKLILIDPKRVEFECYKELPHLALPIADDTDSAIAALRWAIDEMNRRYKLLSESGVRNTEQYNEKNDGLPEAGKLPYIIIMIDELSDYMLTVSEELEALLCAVSAKGRAAGIHIIAATQRPTADVVTGTLRANLPSRIALKVCGRTEARVMDSESAEMLLGKGDMLYTATGGRPLRAQGAFVSSDDIMNTVRFITENNRTADFDAELSAEELIGRLNDN